MDGRDGGAPDVIPHLLAIASEDEAVATMQEVIQPWSTGPTAFRGGTGLRRLRRLPGSLGPRTPPHLP